MAVMGIISGCVATSAPPVVVAGEAFLLDPAWFSMVDSGVSMTDPAWRLAIIFVPPKTGTVTHIEWLGTTPAGNVTLTLEGVGADGFPDGVVIASHTQDFGVVAAAAWNVAGPLATPVAVTAGPLYALRVAKAMAGALTLHGWVGWYGSFKIPYHANHNTVAWGKLSRPPSLILRYDDGQRLCVRDTHPAISISGLPTLFNAGDSPDERGIRFVAPISGSCLGAVFFAALDPNGDGTVVLYDGNDAVLAESAWNSGDHIGTGGFWLHTRWPTSVPVTEGQVYRLALRATSGDDIGVYQWTYDIGHQDNVLGVLTTRTNAGAWTETPGTSLHAAIELESFA